MKIALAQINPTIGDFAANVDKIVEFSGRAAAAGCQLVVFPELAICGYPPQDLLERCSFLEDHDAALQELIGRVGDIGVICGVISRHAGSFGKPLHNSAVLIADGRCEAVHKRLLPTYDVFDESRYFEPAQESPVLEYNGLRLGITICEDVFNEPQFLSDQLVCCHGEQGDQRLLYKDRPLADLFADHGGVDLLINIAASPFQSGKAAAKTTFFKKLISLYKVPFIYVNQVGGQDSLVFDGKSMVVAPSGELISQAAGFQEELLVVETDPLQHVACPAVTKRVRELPGCDLSDPHDLDDRDVFAALVLGTLDYVKKCGFNKVLIGLSGGIDSALTAAVAVWALGGENVMGIALPSHFSSQGSVDDAKALANNLGIEFKIIPIKGIFDIYTETLEPHFQGYDTDVTEQNIQARIRGNLLMALSNKFGRLLLSTGNKSEMAVGYCTLYGDMSGGLSVISDVPKMMVYRICRLLNSEQEVIPWETINKPPSAELAPDQTDQDDLPPYEILDAILEAHLEKNMGLKEIVAAGFAKEVVIDVLRRVRLNEHKRKQAPPGVKVTSKAFGYGRRYPTTQKYIESE